MRRYYSLFYLYKKIIWKKKTKETNPKWPNIPRNNFILMSVSLFHIRNVN